MPGRQSGWCSRRSPREHVRRPNGAFHIVSRRRVKITGIGPVTPAGIGFASFWDGMCQGRSFVSAVNRFHEEAGAFVAAEVKDFALEDIADRDVNTKRMPRHTQFALAAAILALRSAGVDEEELRQMKTAILVGASLMDFGTINKSVELIARKGPIHGLPTAVSTASVSSIAGAISEYFSHSTHTMSFQSACCSGVDAIGHGMMMVATGQAQLVICGGTEAPIYFHPMFELKLAGLAPGNPLAPEIQCRPFDLWRTTGVIGEGSCMLVLEPEDSPRPALAYLAGYSFAADSGGNLCSGLSVAAQGAVHDAGMSVGEVESISLWGPGHRLVDQAEASAMHDVFGKTLPDLPATSIKGAVGTALGASGAIQVGCAVATLQNGVIPSTVNWTTPDPACRLGLSNAPTHISVDNVLINSHGISGTNACLMITR